MQKLDPKIDGATPDIVEQNIDKLKELFPEVFAEGKIDFEALKETLGNHLDEREERYSFTWNGKSRARLIAQTPSTGTLRPCPEESVNWDTTQNLFIEGDNLEVLKLLQKSYHKKIKVIYIDPPYNTGAEFIYPDNFHDNIKNYMELTRQTDEEGRKLSTNSETSGRYHTDWLNMMYPRLKLARNLLCDKGVIFISIDDNEVDNLKKICNEIFGEENFAGCISRLAKKTSDSGKYFAPSKDYVLTYLRNFAVCNNFTQNLSDDDIKKYNKHDDKGQYKLVGFYQASLTLDRSRHARYYIDTPDGEKCIPPENKRWRTVKETYQKFLNNGEIEFVRVKSSPLRDENGNQSDWNIYTKQYLSRRQAEGKVPRDYIDSITNVLGTKELKKLGLPFDFPKPSLLIKHVLEISGCDNNDVVLDFFAGSATAAHAVLDVNNKDNGKRRFIMVQLPEPCDEKSEAYKAGYKTIADIGKERICRVINKIEAEQSEKSREEKENLLGKPEEMPQVELGFKVFKLDTSNIKPWDADFDNLENALFDAVENIKPERSEADVLYELLLKYGLDLAVPIEERQIDGKTVYIIGAGALVVCLANKISLQVVEGIAALKDELKPEIMRVVFKDAGFADDVVKTNAVQILRQADIEDVKSL